MGCVLKLIALASLIIAGATAEDYPRSTRTIARLFGFGGSQPEVQQPVVPPQAPVQPFPPGPVQQVQVRKPLVYSVKYYDRTGDANADAGPEHYQGVQPTQRIFLNLYTGQTSPVYYDNKGQLLVPCPVYDHVYVQQHANVVGVGGPDQKQKSAQQQQQQQQQQPVGVVKPVPVGPVPVPVAYNINNVGQQVPVPYHQQQQQQQQHVQQQRQQQETQQQPVSVVPPPPQPVPVPVVQHGVPQGNFVPIPVPSQVVYDRYQQHLANVQQQQQQQHQMQVQSPYHVTSTSDVIYYTMPTSTSGIPVAVQGPPPHHQVQHHQNGVHGQGPVQVQVPFQYGAPPGMVYTGLPYDVPYQYVITSPPGSYYPYVYVKQATPTVTVQHSTQSSSTQTQVPGQVQVQHGVHAKAVDQEQVAKKDVGVPVDKVESH